MSESIKRKVKQLRRRERQLQRELNELRKNLNDLQQKCKHERKQWATTGDDGNRAYYVCLDCEYGDWE